MQSLFLDGKTPQPFLFVCFLCHRTEFTEPDPGAGNCAVTYTLCPDPLQPTELWLSQHPSPSPFF